MAQMQAVTRSIENGSMELQRCSEAWDDRRKNLQKDRFLHRRQRRRGVLLLVCLVLLVMFLMLGVTFVLTAGNFRRSSEAYQRMLERPSADLPERSGDLLDSVAHDLIRGTSSQDSPFAEENLLEDLYGRPALRGVVTDPNSGGLGAEYKQASNSSVEQLTVLDVTPDGDFSPPQIQDYYAGQVLTFLTGKAKGQSTRIVGWNGSDQLTVISLPKASSVLPTDLNNSHFLVNGRPFSGDGTDSSSSGRQKNEDYDKADANNPWLTSFSSDTITPAYSDKAVTAGASAQVDNDGDGEKDSVWVDTGLPLQLQSDGSYVKPLVAMMVRDLDGRVNLNAHGSVAQQQAMGSGTTHPLGQGYGPAEIDPFYALTVTSGGSDGAGVDIMSLLGSRLSDDVGMPADGTSGEGYAEPIATEPPADSSDQQDFSNYYQFGSESAVIAPLDPHGQAYAEKGSDGSINLKKVDNTNLVNDFSGTTYDLELDTSQGIPPGWHAPYAPTDLERVLRFSDADADGLDSRLYEDLAFCLNGGTEIDADVLKALRDRITSESWDLPVPGLSWPNELAGRISDTPSPGHIADLFAARFKKEDSSISDAVARQRAVALIAQLDTDTPFDTSQSPPKPNYVDSAGTLIDQTQANWEDKVVRRGLIDRGLMRGTRMNINRLFGDGVDSNYIDTDSDQVPDSGQNAVIDEPGEVAGDKVFAENNTDIPFDHDGDGNPGAANDKYARQNYAQQLYLLLMLLADDLDTEVPADGASATDKKRILARKLAQFAVNAVDYRDPDSIMTGFEYDADPFDATGWDVDGDLTTDESNDGVDNDGNGKVDTADLDANGNPQEVPGSDRDRGVVWGCEDPVLYLTETYALHDRRVRDLNQLLSNPLANDLINTTRAVNTASTNANLEAYLKQNYPDDNNLPPSGNLPANDINGFFDNQKVVFEDKDFDQYAKPEGSLFVELYHARANPKVAGSKYALRQDIYTSTGEVDLGKANASGSPVWRLAISIPHPTGPDVASTPNDETLYAGPGSPVFNQLADVDGDGNVGSQEAVLGSAGGFWSPSVTLQPGLPILKDPSSTSSSPSAIDLTAKDKFNRQASPAGDDAIQLDRLVYFSPKAQITGHVSLVRNAMQARKNISGALVDSDWDGIYCAGSSGQLAEGAYTVVGPRSFTPFGREADSDSDGQKEDAASSNGIHLGGNAILCTAASDSDIPLSISEPLPGPNYYTKNMDPTDVNSKYAAIEDDPADNDQDWMKRMAVTRSLHFPSAAPMNVASPNANRPNVEITDLQVTTDDGDTRTYDLKENDTARRPFVTHFEPGTIEQYCTVFLQRLANPLEAWNPETNPYVSVDAMPVDLTVFNGDDDTSDPLDLESNQASSADNLAGEFIEPVIKNSRQRGSATNLLFPVAGTVPTGSFPLSEGANNLGTENFGSGFATPSPFWPNRPFVSQYEMLMVPASAPGKLAFELGSHTGTPESTFADGFPYLLNFFYNPGGSVAAPQLGRVFDYLHVPSKYAGTQISLSPNQLTSIPGFSPPFNVVSTYREPGRVNLNTIETEEVWNSVMNGSPGGDMAHHGPAHSKVAAYTLHGAGEVSESDGSNGSSLSLPLLRSELGFEGTDTDSPFLRYQPINRMGNLVTNRSNVYAVWMTLGFFETNKSGTLTDPPVEAGGSDLERHRAFYIIDRSIPVGYENGHDHNTEDVFRVKRYIE